MAIKAGSKIICEAMKPKFNQRVFRYIYYNCRLHHALAIQGKTGQLNRTHAENSLLPNLLWSGFVRSVMTSIITLSFLRPDRYGFTFLSKFSSGSLLPATIDSERRFDMNEQSEQLNDTGAELLKEPENNQIKTFHQRRNLNKIAFTQKQDLISNKITPVYSTRLKVPSRFVWKVPIANPFKTNNQFIHRANERIEINFADNLSTLGDTRSRFNLNFQRRETDQQLYKQLSKSKQYSHQDNDSLQTSSVGVSAPLTKNKMHEFKKLVIQNINDSKDRTVELSHRSKMVYYGEDPANIKIQSSMRPSATAKKDYSTNHRDKGFHPPHLTKPSSKINRNTSAGPVQHSQKSELVNPGSISSYFPSIRSYKFQDQVPLVRLKRDLISVEAITRSIPKTRRSHWTKRADNIEVMPLLKRLSPVSVKQNNQLQVQRQVKTWNFTPKRGRLPIDARSYERYTHKVTLDPSGTGLRQKIVMKTPKYHLPRNEDSMLPVMYQQSKIPVMQA